MGLDQVTIDWWRGCEAGVFDTWNQLMTYIAVSYMCLVGAWTPADAGDASVRCLGAANAYHARGSLTGPLQ